MARIIPESLSFWSIPTQGCDRIHITAELVKLLKIIYNTPMHRIRFTKEGYEKLQKEYEDLKKERPETVEHLKKARELGDLSENGYYKASRAKLSSIDSRLFRIDMDLKHAIIIDETVSKGVDIGKTVTIKNDEREMTYHIVGDLEADPIEGKISLLSPMGRAISGKQIGDKVEISTPSGKVAYKITKID
jgi:transcription elongation factor GreA